MAMLVNFFATPAFSLIPLLVTKHFNGQALQLGYMNSAWGFGVVAGGLLLSAWGGFKKRILTTMFGLAGMGLGILLIGFAPASLLMVGIAGMALSGIMNPITNGPIQAIFQSSIVPEMQGRVFGLISSVSSLVSPLSLLVAGPISDAIGIRSWYWVAGFACILMAFVSLLIRPIMAIEEQGQEILAAQQPQPEVVS